MDATPLVLHEMRAVCDAVTQGSANPGLKYGRPLAFVGGAPRLREGPACGDLCDRFV